MGKLHILLNYKKEILSVCLRAISGLFPVAIAFFLPIIIGVDDSSFFFESYARVLIISSLLRIGIDLMILKKEVEICQLISFILIVSFLHILIGVVYFYMYGKILLVGSLFFSLNVITSSFILSNGMKNFALVIQFLLPSIFILLTSLYIANPIVNISISYGAPCVIYLMFLIYKKHNLIKFEKITLINLSRANFYLVLYTIISISIANIPILIGADFLSDIDVIWINKLLKLIGVSSFVSGVVIFSFNNELRKFNKKSFFKVVKKTALLLYSFYVFSFYILSCFMEDMYSLSLNKILSFSLVLLIITIGNICGHFLILKSKELHILLSIALALLICQIPFYVLNISRELLLMVYVSILVIDSILKFIFLWKKA